MEENIKVRWLVDDEQTKIAPKTLITQVLNENGSRFKDSFDTAIAGMTESVEAGNRQIRDHANNAEIHVTAEEKEAWNNIEVPSLDGYATEEYVEALYKNLGSTAALAFYCIEDVTIVTNGVSKVYPANSNVDITFAEDDVFEIIPTSDNSILSLSAYPGALGTYYSWLEGVKLFSNILFDMNNEEMYSKWSQGNQGAYQVQFAQYTNCIFWSDNPYISDVARRTNYTLCSTSELPLCYSTIPDNTFKSFYLAFGVNNDPNWSNPLYKESFAKANWATQVFSYYGARIVGYPGHDSANFTITLPKDCRGLMFDARNIECAGTFDAINTTNFGAKSGSWREAFGDCPSLRRLYIKNLKANLNISWSPIDYDSINYIINSAANTSKITISVSPYTYNLLSQADFDLATSKNITIALISTNYVEDKRLGEIAGKADKTYVDAKIADLVNSAPEALDTLGELATAFGENKEVVDALNESITNKQNKNVIVYRDAETEKASMTAPQIMEKVRAGENVYYTTSLSGGTLHPYLEGADTGVFFYSNYIDNDKAIGTGILVSDDGTITTETYQLEHLTDTEVHITSAERNRWNDTYTKTETDNLLNTKANYENPTFEGSMSLNGEAWFAGDVYTGSTSGTHKDEGSKKLATEEYVNNNSFSGDYEDLTNKPFYYGETWVLISDSFSGTSLTVVNDEDISNGFSELGRYRFTINGTDVYEYEKTTTGGQYLIGDGSMQTIPFGIRKAYDSGTKTHFSVMGPIGTITSCKAEYYTSSVKYLDDMFLSDNIARIEDLVGVKTSQGGEIFNDIENNTAQATYAHAEGENTTALSQGAHAEGQSTTANGNGAHAEGQSTTANGNGAHAEGYSSESKGVASHAEGYLTKALIDFSHSEGCQSQATSVAAHAEGHTTEASGQGSHSEGGKTKATNTAAHAEGYQSEATGEVAHAEGYITKATGYASHSEGRETQASEEAAHAEGLGTVASEHGAHAEGIGTIAAGYGQHAEGKFNIEDSSEEYLHITGNGISGSNRSNAYTLDKNGNAWYSGDVYTGSTSGINKDEGSKKLATEEYVNASVANANVQSDWNQNDETAVDYIKNRTHYAIIDETELLNTEFEILDYSSGGSVKDRIIPPLTIGDTYKIIYDGVEYIEVCYSGSEHESGYFGETTAMLGCKENNNYAFQWGDGDIPFLMYVHDGASTGAIYAKHNVVHTLVISKYDKTIVPLSDEFIPDTVVRKDDIANIQSDWTENDENSLSYIKNRQGGYKTFEAVCSAVFTANDDNTLSGVLPEGFVNWRGNSFEFNNEKQCYRVRIKENGVIRTVHSGGIGTGGYVNVIDAEGNHLYCRARLYDGESITIQPKDEYHYESGNSYTFEFLGNVYHKFDINYLDERVYSELNPPPQVDWNESDSSNLSYIQNRPFYEEFSRTPIMPGISVDVSDPAQGGLFQLNEPLVVGNSYSIWINDDLYECMAYKPAPAAPIVLGNGNIFGFDMYEDMPFTLINSDEAPTDCTLVPQSAGRYSVMIALTTSHVKQIDEKYIPLVEDSFETIASVKNFENDSEYVMESIELNTNTVMLSINGDERSITLSGIDGNYQYEDETLYFAVINGRGFYIWSAVGDTYDVEIKVAGHKKIKEEYLPAVNTTPQPDWSQNDETAPDYIKNRIGGYEVYEALSSLTFVAVDENTLRYTIDANDENAIALYDSLYPYNLGVLHLAIIRETGRKRWFSWHYEGSGVQQRFRDENNNPITPYIFFHGASGINNGADIDCTTLDTYVVGNNYTVDFYTISIKKIPTKFLEEPENVLLKTEQVLTDEELAQVKTNLRYIGKNVGGLTVTPYVIEEKDFGTENHRIEETPSEPVIAGEGAEVFNLYDGMNVASGAYSVSQGNHTVATGAYSVAQGHWTMATGMASKASGLLTVASGNYATAEGTRTVASKNNTHAEGDVTQATGTSAHSEGNETVASGNVSHAEGWKTKASGIASHAEGEGTIAAGRGQTAMGRWNVSDTSSKLIVGIGTGDTARKNGFRVSSTGQGYFASDVYANDDKKLATEEFVNNAVTNIEIPTNDNVLVKTEQTLTDEELTQVRSNLKFIGKDVAGQTFNINGTDIVASANAEIFGDYTNNKCTGQWSIVEGSENIATGRACHVEGAQNQALNDGCHVEGVGNTASGYWSHAEGERTIVTSYASHAEGSYTKMPDNSIRQGTASGYASHVEGGGCHAQGSCSHSEGLATTTKGNYSHSEGRYTIAGSPAQHVEGIANIEDTASTYIHIAGNGDWNAPSNAHTLDWDGNAWFAGDVYVGSTSGVNKDEGSKKLVTVEEMNAAIQAAIQAAFANIARAEESEF